MKHGGPAGSSRSRLGGQRSGNIRIVPNSIHRDEPNIAPSQTNVQPPARKQMTRAVALLNCPEAIAVTKAYTYMAEDAQYAYDFLLLAPNQPNIIATYSQTNRSSSARTGWVGVVEPGQLRHCDVLFNRAFDASTNDYIFRTYYDMQEVKLIAHRRLLICRLLSRAIEHSHDGNNTLIDRVFSMALLNRNVPVSQVLNDIENMLNSPSHSSIISLLQSQDPLFSGFTIGHCIMGMFHISFALRNKFLFHQLVFFSLFIKDGS